MMVRNKDKDIDELVEILNRVFKKENIESTIDQIYTDLAACGYDNTFKIKEGIDKTISHMNRNIGAFWQHSNILCKVSSLYLMLTTWNKEYAKKYKSESIDDRQAFINKIIDFALVFKGTDNIQKKEKEMRLEVEIKEAVGMIDGYVEFNLIVYDTLYSQKDIFNSLKMRWSRTKRAWTKSGHIKGNIKEAKEAEQCIFDHYSKKIKQEI